ncbi:MAG: 7-dehydrocholesterol reductase, partial [Chlamydiae bacterium]|nr:7-dehydrocholesterol reductase [Chlamydiota bacterium]
MTVASSERSLYTFFRRTLVPIFLILACPSIVMLIWHTSTALGGSLSALWQLFAKLGFFSTLYHIWHPVFFGSLLAWKMIGIFALVQLIIMKVTPGKKFYGPITPKGNVAVYKANGPQAFFISLGLFYMASFKFHLFAPTIIYDHFGEILGALNFCSFGF